MSGIEAVGLALGLWPVLQNVIGMYKASRDGSAVKDTAMSLKTYELIYRQSISKLLQGDQYLTDKDRMGLITGEADFAGLWKDEEFIKRLYKRLGPDVFHVLQHETDQIVRLLRALEKKIKTKDTEATTLEPSATWGTTESSASVRDRRHLPKASMRVPVPAITAPGP